MIQINDTIVSLDIITTKFVCNLDKCKGACCIHGDSGAPLEEEEAKMLEKIYPIIKPYMRKSGIKAIENSGNVHRIDNDGDVVTILIDNKECSFVVFEEEFDNIYEVIWQSGPIGRYDNPDSWFNNYRPRRLF